MGACLSSPYLLPVVLPVRHVFRSFATNLSKEVPLKFSGEIHHRQCGGLNFVVWRRSTLFVIAVMQILSIVFAALDASTVNGQTARAALAVITGDGTGFESSCTTTCTAQGAADQSAYDTVCPVACSGATTLMQAQVTGALAADAARHPASCADVVAAAGDVDKLRVGVDALHAAALSLSLIMILAASCNWQDHATSAKCVVVSFVLRVTVPYVTSVLPWFEFLDFDCPEFRGYAGAVLIAPLLSVVLAATPGLVRASRLMNTVTPKSAVPVLFMRIAPALHFLSAWVAVAMVYQFLGSVVLMVGIVLFTVCGLVYCRLSFVVEDLRSGRKLAVASGGYRWTHFFMFGIGGAVVLVFAAITSTDFTDTYGDVPAYLPRIPGLEFLVAYGCSYVVDFFLATLLFCDFISDGLMLLRKRDAYLEQDSELAKLAGLVMAAPPVNVLDGAPAQYRTGGPTVSHTNPARGRHLGGDVEGGVNSGDDSYESDAGTRPATGTQPAAPPIHRAGSGIPPHARPSPQRSPRKQRRPSRGARGGRGGRGASLRGGRGRGRGGSSRVVI